MDQVKIGRFIAECRKKNNLTQMQLAEKLNITDRAISKWENGKAMPDSSIMLDLCSELKISVNELLSGEMVEMKNYDESGIAFPFSHFDIALSVIFNFSASCICVKLFFFLHSDINFPILI